MNHINDRSTTDLGTWRRTHEQILAAAHDVMGPIPAHDRSAAPVFSVDEEVDCGTYLRQRIRYESEPGCETPAFLCRPHSARPETPARGVLCLHPTNLDCGYEDVVGLSGRKNRDYASELTARGLVTISPSYPLMASYQPHIDALGYVSGTMKAIWDNMRALDLLQSLPFVDGSGFGAIGHSLGGHNSVYTAVFDPRIKAIVSSCGLDSYLEYKDGNIAGWTQTRYMPRIGSYNHLQDIPFDFHDLVAALAPRACLISAPIGDDNFKWKSAAAVVDAARTVYQLHGASDHLEILHPECDHDFPGDIRSLAYAFIEQHLIDPA